EGEKIYVGTETNSNLYHELYYHFLGTDQSSDVLCWRDHENPKYMFGSKVTDDGKFGYCVLVFKHKPNFVLIKIKAIFLKCTMTDPKGTIFGLGKLHEMVGKGKRKWSIQAPLRQNLQRSMSS
ncbi:hypothetical protein AALP_AA5G021500, partial [Arabis alpina]